MKWRSGNIYKWVTMRVIDIAYIMAELRKWQEDMTKITWEHYNTDSMGTFFHSTESSEVLKGSGGEIMC